MAGNDWSITAQGIRLEDIRDFAQKLCVELSDNCY